MKRSLQSLLSFFLSLTFILSMLTGCAEKEVAETGPLRICIDTAFYYDSESVPYANVQNGAKFLAQMVASHIDDLEAEEIELELIPASGTERQTALTRIRTEIMSGEGPDVFLCSCIGTSRYDSEETALFPFPERAMEEGIFLPLDDYLKNAEWMEPDKMLSVIMEAGQTEKGQVILPISYSLWITAYKAEDAELPAADTTFADVIASDNPILQSTMAYTARDDDWLRIAFPYLFTELADAHTGELTITEEKLFQTINEAVKLKNKQSVDLPPHFTEQLTLQTYETKYGGGIYGSTEQVMLPVYNVDGGATALICSFGAVNANTQRPKSAFFVLDYFLSKYMHDNDRELYRYFFEDAHALPVRMDRGESRLGSEAFSAYIETREQIAYSRFFTILDQELMELSMYCGWKKMTPDEETMRKRVSKSYARMKRLLDES